MRLLSGDFDAVGGVVAAAPPITASAITYRQLVISHQ
jgi:hypothetical protein